jgi:NAD(P)-dependent dehydrogenase (short-subunit alcohol dehydrogenase family)
MLEGKSVLITGAKGGLGTFVTWAFLDAGAKVAGVSRSIRPEDFPHARFTAIAAELGSAEAAMLAVRKAESESGPIDAVVHLVGGFAGGKSVEKSGADLERMLDLNFRSAFHVFSAAIERMRGGAVLAIGSRTAAEPAAGFSAYSASKAALVSLVRTIAAEGAARANIVLPGTIDLPANRPAEGDLPNLVRPEQIASLLVYLASDAARQVNGAVIPVYGGGV